MIFSPDRVRVWAKKAPLLAALVEQNKRNTHTYQKRAYTPVVVEMMGLEPTAYALRTHRSTSWATSPSFDIIANGEKKDKRLRAFFRKSFAKHWSRFEAARFEAAVVFSRRGLRAAGAASRTRVVSVLKKYRTKFQAVDRQMHCGQRRLDKLRRKKSV